MKSSDFEVGCKVKHLDEGHRGVVIGNKLSDGDQVVAVELDDGSLKKINVEDLTVLDDKLEEEFAQIQLKLTEAARALREANKLMRAHGTDLSSAEFDSEYEDLLDISELFAQLREAGWSTSSMRC